MPEMKRKSVLVVDDDQGLCKMMARALEQAGYTAFTAFNGEAGLEIFKRENPDLVLLDFAMPGMNGFEVVSEIRRLEAPPNKTIIALITAYSQTFLVTVDFQVGIDGYLTKPMLPSDLVTHVDDLFAARSDAP